jgi:hypothetical protein
LCEFEENSLCDKISSNEWIIGDQGFKGLRGKKILSYFTFKETSENKNFLRIRSVIENLISMMKKWKICKYPFQYYHIDIEQCKDEHDLIWRVVAGLCNLYHDSLR